MIKQTGSTIDVAGRAHYQTLAGNAAHVTAAFGMMANWELPTLERDMKRLATPLYLVVGLHDAMVKPRVSEEAARIVQNATMVRIPGLGHLAHEEQPDQIATVITDIIAGRPPLQNAPSGVSSSVVSRRMANAKSASTKANTTQGRPA